MPQQTTFSVENNFTRGLITESTGLNFPENACTDTDNCVFSVLGNVRSRDSLNFEQNHVSLGINSDLAISTYLWRSVNGNGDLNFWVVQVGGALDFYVVNSDGSALSTNVFHNAVALTGQFTDGTLGPLTECQFSSGMGYLFVVQPYMNPISIKYTAPATFTATQIDVKVRDLDGLDDGLSLTARPPSGSGGYHQYNLLNQGWTDSLHGDYTASTTIDIFQNATTLMPSNADVWYTFKSSNITSATSTGSNETFRPFVPAAGRDTGILGTQTGTAATDIVFPPPVNTPAPKGHFLLPAFNGSRDLVYYGNLLTPSFPDLSSGKARPGTTAFYAGRVWYAGVSAAGFNSSLYFTQVLETISNASVQFGNCYQKNDPTAEDLFDLLPTDGGIVKILDCGTIYKLFTLKGRLLVFASNGVWSISGSAQGGFAANDYVVEKISAIETLSGTSFVDVLGIPIWWAQEGIYTLQLNPQTNNIIFEPLTVGTIQSYYDTIPLNSRKYARGYYHPSEYNVQWLFRTTTPTTTMEQYTFDGILNYNVAIKAFYPWSVDITKIGLHGIVVIDRAKQTDQASNPVDHAFKYLCSHNNVNGTLTSTMADNLDVDHPTVDWFSYDSIGSDYEATFTTGFKVHGKGVLKTQIPYLYTYSKNDEPTAFYLQSLWDYASTGNSGKWSAQQQVNNFNPNFSVIIRRHRLRGRGMVLQIKVTSVEGQPFDIIGWSLFETINQGV